MLKIVERAIIGFNWKYFGCFPKRLGLAEWRVGNEFIGFEARLGQGLRGLLLVSRQVVFDIPLQGKKEEDIFARLVEYMASVRRHLPSEYWWTIDIVADFGENLIGINHDAKAVSALGSANVLAEIKDWLAMRNTGYKVVSE